MYQLSNIELGCDPDNIRAIERRTGLATPSQIEQVRNQRPNATLLEVYLVIAQQQAQKRLDDTGEMAT